MLRFSIFGQYKCNDCGEIFENRIAAIKHHMETKHENFELIGCNIKTKMKS